MMKHLLIMTAALALSVSASAQQVQHRMDKAMMMQTNLQKEFAPIGKMELSEKSGMMKKAPRKNYATKMYYARPEGTFYETFQASNGNYYCYMFAPNFVDLTWHNMSDESKKGKTIWSFGDETVDGNEQNDLVDSYAIRPGYLSYVPTLSLKEETFTLGDGFSYAQVGVISTDTIYEMTKWDTSQGHQYSGYQDGSYGFGTGTMEFEFDEKIGPEQVYSDGVVEFFDKPAVPFYLTSIFLPITSNQIKQEDVFADGKELKIEIFGLITDEEGTSLADEPIATMTVTPENLISFATYSDGDGSYGYIEASVVEKDAFGTEYNVPIVLDDAFAVVISGFHQDGVDIGLRFGNAAAASYDFATMTPTYERYYGASDNEYKGMLRTYGVSSQNGALFCYNAVIYLCGMWDGVMVDDDMLEYTAPVEGGTIETVAEFTSSQTGEIYHEDVVYVYTQLPWLNEWEGASPDEENYYIMSANGEDWPDWLHITGFSDQYYADYMVNIIQFAADKLPEGETGRSFSFVIASDKGACSESITVTQGNLSPDAINGTYKNYVEKNPAVYNMAGQKVSNNAKGMVMKNGRKFIVK